MKPAIPSVLVILTLSSCAMQRQSSTVTGRTDEVYFTASDTRKKSETMPQYQRQQSLQEAAAAESYAGNYTKTYANRLRHFGSSSRFNYYDYQPTLVPTLSYNPWFGWTMGLSYVDPRFGYMSGFNSPFSPYYGYNMPFYDPFYSYGWGNSWMYGYNPYYTFNPYFFNPCSYRYGFGYGYYNPHYRNYYYRNYNRPGSGSRTPAPYGRRTGSSTNVPSSTTQTAQPQNSSTQQGTGNTGKKWYSGGNSDRGGSGGTSGGGSGSSGRSGGNSDRGSSGSSGSNRRR